MQHTLYKDGGLSRVMQHTLYKGGGAEWGYAAYAI